MSQINAPHCISCGLGGVYHRKTNPKPWRCRTCGHEFSDDDLKRKKEEDRRAEEARQAEEAKQAEEKEQWLLEHGFLEYGPYGHYESLSHREVTALKRFEVEIGRKITEKEFRDIYSDLGTGIMNDGLRPYRALDPVFKKHRDWSVDHPYDPYAPPSPGLREKPGNWPVRYILAAIVIFAVIGYAC